MTSKELDGQALSFKPRASTNMRSKFEIKAQEKLEAEGYEVDFKIRPTHRFARGFKVDIWGCFDLVAKKKGKPLLWVSVKSATDGLRTTHLEEVISCWLPEGNIKEIWVFRGDKDIRKVVVP